MWPTWSSKESIINAAKRFGISATGVNIESMQHSKFQRAEKHIQNSPPTASTPNSSLFIVSPKCVQSESCEYYKQKFESAMELIHNMSDETINLEVARVLKVNKIKPRETRKPVHLTQVCGSMDGKNVCELLQVLQHEKIKR